MTKRIAFYLFYDPQGIVDEYIPYKLERLQEFVEDIYFVCNGKLTIEGRNKIESMGIKVFCRENNGFDVHGYKEGMELLGYEKIASEYDELILLNYTFFGPIYPFSELFSEMEKRDCDFWGISDHKAMEPNPFTGTGILPQHIQSHFLAIRSSLLKSIEFKRYWLSMPKIESYVESILQHESKFTSFFESIGFKSSVYIDSKNYASDYPTQIDVVETINDRCPILKRRLFFQDPFNSDLHAIDLRKAVSIIEKKSDYSTDLIYQNINRTTKPKDLSTNLEQIKIFSTSEDLFPEFKISDKKIAVIAHIYYVEMWDEISSYIKNIPTLVDLYISTSTKENKEILEQKINRKDFHDVVIRVPDKNQGRDMSSLFITFKDIGANENYDYICRIHSKKSPQNGYHLSNHFKELMYTNNLGSEKYIKNLLGFMDENKHVGFICPPLVQIGFYPFGHAWFNNKPGVTSLCEKLKIKVPIDDDTPLAAYGTMFWYKPPALKKLFDYDFKFTDFNPEPHHIDGGLAHILERTICYAAKDAGFSVYNVLTTDFAERYYARLIFKYEKIMSLLPGTNIHHQYHYLKSEILNQNLSENSNIHLAIINLLNIIKYKLRKDHKIISKLMYYPYKISKKIYKLIFIRDGK